MQQCNNAKHTLHIVKHTKQIAPFAEHTMRTMYNERCNAQCTGRRQTARFSVHLLFWGDQPVMPMFWNDGSDGTTGGASLSCCESRGYDCIGDEVAKWKKIAKSQMVSEGSLVSARQLHVKCLTGLFSDSEAGAMTFLEFCAKKHSCLLRSQLHGWESAEVFEKSVFKKHSFDELQKALLGALCKLNVTSPAAERTRASLAATNAECYARYVWEPSHRDMALCSGVALGSPEQGSELEACLRYMVSMWTFLVLVDRFWTGHCL